VAVTITKKADVTKHALSRRPLHIRDCFRTAHDSPKHALGLDPRVKRFGDKIMRSFNSVERDRTQNRIQLLLTALELDAPHFAECHLIAINLYAG
jgi:hypothetical protein